MTKEHGRSGTDVPSGHQPSASDLRSSQSGVPNAWEQHYDTLARMSKGEKFDGGGMDSPVVPLIVLGFVESREVTKPCRECGTLRFDHRFLRITLAGRVFMEAAASAIEARRAAAAKTDAVEDESATREAGDAP